MSPLMTKSFVLNFAGTVACCVPIWLALPPMSQTRYLAVVAASFLYVLGPAWLWRRYLSQPDKEAK